MKAKPVQLTLQRNCRCQVFPCRALLLSSQEKKKNDKVFFQNEFFKKSCSSSKKRKVLEKQVNIQIGVMDDCLKIKRGETIPLNINCLATAEEIQAAAKQKHFNFNKRFNSEANYHLVFRDGSKVEFIPGTDPPETFTLDRYKEVSGFSFARIVLYLLQDTSDLDCESDEEGDVLRPVTWLTRNKDDKSEYNL